MTRIITIITLISLTLFSCEKANEKELQKDLQDQQSSIQSEMSDLEIRINNFLEDMENEEEGSLSLDSAIYYLEAGFNYRYANSGRDEELVATQVDTFFVDVDIDEDQCTYAKMNETFGYIYTEVSSIFEDINFDNKALHIIDVENAEELTNKFRVISSMKYAKLNDVGDWLWGFNHGPCSGSGPPLDATDFIEDINEREHWNTLPYGIWTNIKYKPCGTSFPLPSGQSNPFGYFDSYLFGIFCYSCNPCLLESEIEYYAEMLTPATNMAINNWSITNNINDKILVESVITPGHKYNSPHYGLEIVHGDFEPRQLSGSGEFSMLN